MNEDVHRFLKMQNNLYNDSVKTLGYQHAKNLIGAPECFEPANIQIQINNLLHNRRTFGRVLEYGCGIGRLMAGLWPHCEYIDGVDMSPAMIEYAKQYLDEQEVPEDKYSLTVGTGYSLAGAGSQAYSFVYSLAVLQHCCVWEIRNNILKELFRVLQIGGEIFLQLNAGLDFNDDVQGTRWYQNYYSAPATNCHWDVKLENPLFLVNDMRKIGFNDIEVEFHALTDPTHHTLAKHEYIIYVRAKR